MKEQIVAVLMAELKKDIQDLGDGLCADLYEVRETAAELTEMTRVLALEAENMRLRWDNLELRNELAKMQDRQQG